MKKVLRACIYQVVEFGSEMEFAVYEQELKNSKKQYQIMKEEKLSDGRFVVHVLKQYNSNKFPEGGELVCSSKTS